MAWIESHQGLARHPKTKKLARILDVSLPASVGHLHFLWWWAMDYAADGDLSRYDSGDLADACGWEGESQHIVNALIHSGFLEERHEGLFIHDWDDYAGRLLDKRKQNAERKRMSRGRHADVTETSDGEERDGQVSHRATVPNHTEPYLTIPKSNKAYEPVPEIMPKGLKKKYADYVFLTEAEYDKLTVMLGEAERDKYFLRFGAWISGQKKQVQEKRSAYLTILNWFRDSQTSLPKKPFNATVAPREKEVEPYFRPSS